MRNEKQVEVVNEPVGESSHRTATLATDSSGAARGIALWLNADELAQLGIDTEATRTIYIRVSDGRLALVPARGGSLSE